MKKIEGMGFIISDCVMAWVNPSPNKMMYLLEPFLSKCFECSNDNNIYLSNWSRDYIFRCGMLPTIKKHYIYQYDSGLLEISFSFVVGNGMFVRRIQGKDINMTEQKQNTTLYDYKQINNYYYKIPKNNLVCFNSIKDKDKFIKIWLWFQGLHDTRTIILQNILTLLRLDYDGYEKIEI